jgi:hypothetical protein
MPGRDRRRTRVTVRLGRVGQGIDVAGKRAASKICLRAGWNASGLKHENGRVDSQAGDDSPKHTFARVNKADGVAAPLGIVFGPAAASRVLGAVFPASQSPIGHQAGVAENSILRTRRDRRTAVRIKRHRIAGARDIAQTVSLAIAATAIALKVLVNTAMKL